MKRIPRFRMDVWAYLSVALGVAVIFLAPQLIEVMANKVWLISTGGVLGYWLDRWTAPYARPDEPNIYADPSRFAFAMQRRALIMAASILGMSLGA